MWEENNEQICFACDLSPDDCHTKKCHLVVLAKQQGIPIKNTCPKAKIQHTCGVKECQDYL